MYYCSLFREIWLDYFMSLENVKTVAFWSAKFEELKHSENDESVISKEAQKEITQEITETTRDITLSEDIDTVTGIMNTPHILSSNQLLTVFKELGHSKSKSHDISRDTCNYYTTVGVGGAVTIGFVGYPNVGKSSTINTLLNVKKVPVSATPGRTKHFQVHEVIVRNNDLLIL